MKKTIFLLLLFMATLMPIKAANYEIRELIPKDSATTIVTNNFSYKSFSYNSNAEQIEFKSIKNLTDEDLPISISIGLFDENNKNIGIINLCSTTEIIRSKEERPFIIKVLDYLAEEKTAKDIKYIAIIDDNINCRTQGGLDYVGKEIDDIGIIKKSIIDGNTKFAFTVFTIIIIILLIIFIYRFLFTNAYRNFDGEDVRKEYAYINKKLKKEREKAEKNAPPTSPKIKTDKTDLVREQEIKEGAQENKEKTELHNLYK